MKKWSVSIGLPILAAVSILITACELKKTVSGDDTDDEVVVTILPPTQISLQDAPLLPLDICSARPSAVSSSSFTKFPFLSNNDGLGATAYDWVNIQGTPFDVNEPSILIPPEVDPSASFEIHWVDPESAQFFTTIHHDAYDSAWFDIAALSMETGRVNWRIALPASNPYGNADESQYSNAGQQVAMVPHPAGGIAVIGVFSDSLTMGAGGPNATTLQNDDESFKNFMAHLNTDGSLRSLRKLDAQILPTDMAFIRGNQELGVYVTGRILDVSFWGDEANFCSPIVVARFDLLGNQVWETHHKCYDDPMDTLSTMLNFDPPLIVPGPHGTFYLTHTSWLNVQFVGTDGTVMETPQPGFDYRDENGAGLLDSYSIVAAQYDLAGRLRNAKLLGIDFRGSVEANPAGVMYQAPYLLVNGMLQQEELIVNDEGNVTGYRETDQTSFLVAYNASDLSLAGVATLPAGLWYGGLIPKGNQEGSAMLLAEYTHDLQFTEPIAQPDGVISDILPWEEPANNYDRNNVVLELCNIGVAK